MRRAVSRQMGIGLILAAGSLLLILTWSLRAAAPANGGAPAAPTTRPAYDWLILDQHRQLDSPSCIPSGVEMVLKLEHREPVDFFELQKQWGNKTDGTFGNFDGRAIDGLTFHRQFFRPRDDHFPMDELFGAIDRELDSGRFVIVSLAWGTEYHMCLIVDHTPSGEYRTVTKSGPTTLELIDTKARIQAMKGTDILTYARTGQPPVSFTFDYNYPPTPGERQWEKTDDTHWQELLPDGTVTLFTKLSDLTDGDDQGTVLRRYPYTGFEVLIPPLKAGNLLNFRSNPAGPWQSLGPIHIPAAPPAVTPVAAQGH